MGPLCWEALFPLTASATFYTNCFPGQAQWPWIMVPVCGAFQSCFSRWPSPQPAPPDTQSPRTKLLPSPEAA